MTTEMTQSFTSAEGRRRMEQGIVRSLAEVQELQDSDLVPPLLLDMVFYLRGQACNALSEMVRGRQCGERLGDTAMTTWCARMARLFEEIIYHCDTIEMHHSEAPST